MTGLIGRVAAIVGCIAAGLLTGLAGLPVSRAATVAGSVAWPWGLALALAGTVCVFVGGRALAGPSGLVGAAAGWLVPLVLVALYRPGDDDIIGQDWIGLVYLAGGILLMVFIAIRAWASTQPDARPPSAPSRR